MLRQYGMRLKHHRLCIPRHRCKEHLFTITHFVVDAVVTYEFKVYADAALLAVTSGPWQGGYFVGGSAERSCVGRRWPCMTRYKILS